MGKGTELIPLQSIDIAMIMTDTDGLDSMLNGIREKALQHVPDTSTVAGRKAIVSVAYAVSRSKTYIEKHGKESVAALKAQVKSIDDSRRKSRLYLDDLKAEIRQPVTDWEAEEKARKEAQALAEKISADWDEALAEDEQFNRTRELEKQQAELNERIRLQEEKEEKARIELNRMEREARLKQEAAKQAREAEAEKRIREKVEAERKIQEAGEAKIRARIAKEKAEQKLEAEKKRLEDIEELNRLTKERLEKEKLEAIAEERRKVIAYADEVEKKRVAEAQRQADIIAERAADELHRKEVFDEAVAYLVEAGNNQYMVTLILRKIEAGEVPNIQFIY